MIPEPVLLTAKLSYFFSEAHTQMLSDLFKVKKTSKK